MAQPPASGDAAFFDSLRTNISGIYFGQVAHYPPEKIRAEFRNAVRDPALLSDETVMANLLFLVRKKAIGDLRDEVSRLVAANRLKPAAQVSALKTLYALGGARERGTADHLVSQALAQLLRADGGIESSPYLEAADRIGGPETLAVLRKLLAQATARQRSAEQRQPGDQAAIGRLDKIRARLEAQVLTLTRKQEVLAKPEPERTADLARAYLRRSAELGCWAYREMLEAGREGTPAAVREVLAGAKGESEIRLRGLALLETMHVPFTPEEQKLFDENAATLRTRKAFYYPACDWEDVLDRS